MNKIQARLPPTLPNSEQQYASSPCLLHEVDPTYLGYWSSDELLTFLSELLKLERQGAKAFAEIGKTADLHSADLALEFELTQASLCVFILEQIEARGGRVMLPSPPCGETSEELCAKCSLKRAIARAVHNQKKLVEAIQRALPKLFDADLHAELVSMRKLHQGRVAHLKDLCA